jgi:hypothetical protein
MTTSLEEQLTAGMRDLANEIGFSRDVLAAAARRHRRRVLVHRALTATGVTGMAAGAAVAAGLAGGAWPAGSGPTAGRPTELTVEYVSAKVDHVLAGEADKVQYGRMQVSYGGRTAHSEFWRDGATGALRWTGVSFPGQGRQDTEMTVRDGQQVITMVDYERKAWWTLRRPDGPSSVPGSGQVPTTPAEIKKSLNAGGRTLTIVDKTHLHGGPALHLRLSGGLAPWAAKGSYDLWVDARSYQPVRLVVVKKDAAVVRIQEDYQWLNRGPSALARLKVLPPRGFAHIHGRQAAIPPVKN